MNSKPPSHSPWSRKPGAPQRPHRDEANAPRPPRNDANKSEIRLYGLNAVHAVFVNRPGAIRKVYLLESRIAALKPLLAWCVKNRVGYRVVEESDLDKLASSNHHEGVVADVLKREPLGFDAWLAQSNAPARCAIWLDGVGNPHNFGAILRSAAHFGVEAILLPENSTLQLSGAAARVAEGGAEAVQLVKLPAAHEALQQLRVAGFTLAATIVRGGDDLFAQTLPRKLVYVMGAEGEGMDVDLAAQCDARLSIPGSGAVESLNVAAATAVFLSEWRRNLSAS